MNRLDPDPLFAQLIQDLPGDLHDNVFVVGSLAAAYHYRVQLEGQGVNTKDADLIVHPTGDVVSCAGMAGRLLELGWRRTDDCYPQASPEPTDELRAIRLYPPHSNHYFIEFLNLPAVGQGPLKLWIPVELADGFYGLPTFKYQGLTESYRERSEHGLEYASPAMMALANLLSHPEVGTATMSAPIGDRPDVLRSAKDLGRVLALAQLEGPEGTAAWLSLWQEGLRRHFPDDWQQLAQVAGKGLRGLMDTPAAFEQAYHTCVYGLLNGQRVDEAQLKATGERLLVYVIEPLAESA